MDRIGFWAIKNHGLTRATNNRAESMNAILKRFVNWKESPVDSIIIALYELSQSFYGEILRGRYNLGNYHLLQHLSSVYDKTIDKPILPEVQTEEMIFNRIKNSREEATEAVYYLLFSMTCLKKQQKLILPIVFHS